MTDRFQKWFLRNTTGLQFLVNERLAKRPGAVGRLFSFLSLGKRQMGRHTIPGFLKLGNHFLVGTYHIASAIRPVFSRYIGVTQGPLNFSGLCLWFLLTFCLINRFRFIRARDTWNFNYQDSPEFWYFRYNMIFPASILHTRISAHYIEINHIFTTEMIKKYILARKEVLAERD